jgi:hypothetical protein
MESAYSRVTGESSGQATSYIISNSKVGEAPSGGYRAPTVCPGSPDCDELERGEVISPSLFLRPLAAGRTVQQPRDVVSSPRRASNLRAAAGERFVVPDNCTEEDYDSHADFEQGRVEKKPAASTSAMVELRNPAAVSQVDDPMLQLHCQPQDSPITTTRVSNAMRILDTLNTLSTPRASVKILINSSATTTAMVFSQADMMVWT